MDLTPGSPSPEFMLSTFCPPSITPSIKEDLFLKSNGILYTKHLGNKVLDKLNLSLHINNHLFYLNLIRTLWGRYNSSHSIDGDTDLEVE